tara:strand:+ start:701 stop:880 length:180 start_codon:yes stop_codon:yes gene_type:complete
VAIVASVAFTPEDYTEAALADGLALGELAWRHGVLPLGRNEAGLRLAERLEDDHVLGVM